MKRQSNDRTSGAKVIVVGGGIAGLATAFHLARGGANVEVLEAGAFVGAEASAHNAGMVRRLGDDPVERALAVRTHAFLSAPDAVSDDFGKGPAPSNDRNGHSALARRTGALLLLGHEPMRLHDAAAHLRAVGVDVEFLDTTSAISAKVASGVLDGCTARVGWYDADALIADSAALCAGLRRGILRMGGSIETNARVHRLHVVGGRLVGVDVDVGAGAGAGRTAATRFADAVVLATGAWSAALAAAAGLYRPLLPLRRTLLLSGKHAASHPDHPWLWIDDAGLYVRPEAGGWLGSPCDERLDPPRSGDVAPTRGHPSPEVIALHHAKLGALLPALAHLRFAPGWSGLRTFCPDRAPLLGPDHELAGLHWCTGLGGFGVSCGYAAGEASATWLLDAPPRWLMADAVSSNRSMLRRFPYFPDGDTAGARLLDVSNAMGAMR